MTRHGYGKVSFYPSGAPAQTEIASIAAEVGRRVKEMLQGRGLLRAGPDDAEPEAQSAMDACMQVGLSRGSFQRIDQGPSAGTNELDARFDHRKRSPWSAEADGFSVDASAQMRAGD